jgi:hypothetical protein
VRFDSERGAERRHERKTDATQLNGL